MSPCSVLPAPGISCRLKASASALVMASSASLAPRSCLKPSSMAVIASMLCSNACTSAYRMYAWHALLSSMPDARPYVKQSLTIRWLMSLLPVHKEASVDLIICTVRRHCVGPESLSNLPMR